MCRIPGDCLGLFGLTRVSKLLGWAGFGNLCIKRRNWTRTCFWAANNYQLPRARMLLHFWQYIQTSEQIIGHVPKTNYIRIRLGVTCKQTYQQPSKNTQQHKQRYQHTHTRRETERFTEARFSKLVVYAPRQSWTSVSRDLPSHRRAGCADAPIAGWKQLGLLVILVAPSDQSKT